MMSYGFPSLHPTTIYAELLGETTTTSSSAFSFVSGAVIVVVDLEPRGHMKALWPLMELERYNGSGKSPFPVSRTALNVTLTQSPPLHYYRDSPIRRHFNENRLGFISGARERGLQGGSHGHRPGGRIAGN